MRELDQRLLQREYALARQAMPSCDWSLVADAIAKDRLPWEKHLNKPDSEINRELFADLEKFRADGHLVPSLRLAPEKVEEVRAYLEALPVYKGYHVFSSDHGQHRLEDLRRSEPYAGYTLDQLLRAPHLVDFFNHPAIIDFLQAVLGCVPTLYSLNAWWSFPATSPAGLFSQRFHRDTDDWRFVTLFVYLTDVGQDGGPHQIVPGSHSLEGMYALIERARARGVNDVAFDPLASFSADGSYGVGFSDACERLFGDRIVNIAGPAGTMFMANTLSLHRGLTPQRTPRLLAWARYGFGINTNSADVEQGPLSRRQVRAELPDTLRNRYVNRLLFEFDRIPGMSADVPQPEPPPPPAPPPAPPRGLERVVRAVKAFRGETP